MKKRLIGIGLIIGISTTIGFAQNNNNPCEPDSPPLDDCSVWDAVECVWVSGCSEDEICCTDSSTGQASCVPVDECCGDCESGSCTVGGGGGGVAGGGGAPGMGGRQALGAGPPASPALGRGSFWVHLGSDEQGRSVGKIQLLMDGAGRAQNATPKSLQVLSRNRAGILTELNTNGLSRVQAPQADIRIVTLSTTAYEMRFYRPGTTNNPYVVWRVRDPDAGSNNYRRVIASQIRNGQTNEEYVYEWQDANELTLTSGRGLREERVTWVSLPAGEGPGRIDTHEIRTPGGAPVERIVRKYREYRFGSKLVAEWRGAEGEEVLFQQTAYFDEPEEVGRYGRLAREEKTGGAWKTYDYDLEGRKVIETSPWNDSMEGSGSNVVITYAYDSLDPVETPKLGDKRWRTRIRSVAGIETKTEYRAFYRDLPSGDQIVVEEVAIHGAPYGTQGNLRTITRKHPAAAAAYLRDRPLVVLHPNGREDHYDYTLGLYTSNSEGLGAFTEHVGGSYLRITETLDALNLVESRSIRTVKIENLMGGELQNETQVWDGTAFETIDWTCYERDEFEREMRAWYANGLTRGIGWDCCGQSFEQFPDGRVEFYEYDALKRMTEKRLVGVSAGEWPAQADRITTYVRDAAGNVLKEIQQAGALTLVTSNFYDQAARRIGSIAPDSLTTSYAYTGSTTYVIAPGGATTITTRQRDGKIASVTGTAVTSQYYEYGITTNGGEWTRIRSGNPTSSVWSLSVLDRDGRIVQTEWPGYGGTTLTNAYEYDDEGRLIKETRPGEPDRLYQYDQAGVLFRTGMDVDGNGVLEPASEDRITETDNRYIKEGTAWYREVVNRVYPNAGSDLAVTTSISRAVVGGSGCSCSPLEQEVVVPGGISTVSSRTHLPGDKLVVDRRDDADSAIEAERQTVNGLLWRSADKTGIQRTYFYDALGRLVGEAHPRTGTNRISYSAAGRVEWIEDAAGNRNSFAYDGQTGRRIAQTDPLSNTVHTAYDAQGRVTNTWGATYPVAYEYDEYGRMTAMKTWRDANGMSDVTLWQYDIASGLLTNKQYADGMGTAYSYTPNGQLATRTWARGVTTSYSYDFFGALTNIHYSDDTPDVSFAYDRLGRQVGISDGTGMRGFAYDASLQLVQETNATAEINRTYDELGRPQMVDLGMFNVNYGYDAYGRFAAVTSTVLGVFHHRTEHLYSYLEDSELLASILSGNLLTTFSYEPHRDVKVAVDHVWDGDPISRFAYSYDAVGRRTARVDSDAITNEFGYNLRSELIAALMGTNSYGYSYDAIGNRTVYTNNTSVTTYVANELNQYTNILPAAIQPVYDSDGNMTYDGKWGYVWDAENRLVAALPVVPNQGLVRLRFAYDYMGRRVEKEVETWTGMEWSNVVTIAFTYDGWNMIRETRSDESKPNYYVWGLDLSGTLQGAGGVGGLLARVRQENIPHPLYYASDANGNITDVLNNNGTLAAHYEYDPFGNTIAQSGDEADANPFRFSTKYWDGETGSYYYGYRYYSPELGRWLNRDPIGEMGGINLYGFVNNDPLDNTDSLGLSILGQIKSAYGQIKAAIALCASLPKYVDSPVIECPSIEGAYRHCWNNCVATRCSAWNPGAISAIAGLGTWAELTNWHHDSLSDLLSNLQGIVNAFKISSCESSCTKTAQDSADKNCCPKNHAWDKSHPKCCP